MAVTLSGCAKSFSDRVRISDLAAAHRRGFKRTRGRTGRLWEEPFPERDGGKRGAKGPPAPHEWDSAQTTPLNGFFRIPGNPDMTNPPPSLHCRP
jgi:hypothetical protein